MAEADTNNRVPAAGPHDTEPHADVFPDAFGDYVRIDNGTPLGEGGFGVVFPAVHVWDGADCVVEFLRPARAALPQARERFRREAELSATLAHPNCVRVRAVGEAGGVPYIVMERVRGTDAGRLAASRRRVAPATAADVIRQAALGCHHAHSQGRPIVHRDIKPANILVEAATGRAVLTDFGLSKALDPDGAPPPVPAAALTDSQGSQPGTLAYMAPEQADPELGAVGPRSDVYSLGAALYALVTGRAPFPVAPGAGTAATHYDVLWRPPRRFRARAPAAVRQLEKVCRICLQKLPEDRYPTAAALADDLDRACRGLPVRGRLPTPLRRARNAVWRNRGVAAAAAALVAALAVSLALLWQTSADGRAVGVALTATSARAAAATRASAEARRRAGESDLGAKAAAADRRWAQYGSDVQAVGGYWERGDYDRARELVERYAADDAADLRGPEWLYWRARLRTLPRVVRGPGGCRSAAVSPGGRVIAVTTARRLYVWKAASGAPVVDAEVAKRTPVPNLDERDDSVAFSPDGGYVAAVAVDGSYPRCTGTLTVWSVGEERPVVKLESPWIGGRSVLFSPGGETVVAGAYDAGIVVVDVATGRATHKPCPAAARVAPGNAGRRPIGPVDRVVTNEMAFVNDRLVTCTSYDDPVEWDPGSWEFARHLRPGLPGWDDSYGKGAAACESTLFVKRLRSGWTLRGARAPWRSVFARLRANQRLAACVSGSRYVEGREDGTVHVYTFDSDTADVSAAAEEVVRGHTGPVKAVAATGDGFLSVDEGGSVIYRPWSQVDDMVKVRPPPDWPDPRAAGWRSGGVLVERSSPTTLKVTDPRGVETIPCPASMWNVELSPTGRYLYFRCISEARDPVPVWDRARRRPVAELPPIAYPGYQGSAFAADESHLAVPASHGYVVVVSLPGGDVSRVDCADLVTYCGISPGGRFVCAGAPRKSGVFDRVAGRWLYEADGKAGVFAFSPGLRYCFVGTAASAANPGPAVVDLSSGAVVPTAFGRTGCNEFEFAADGRRAYLRAGDRVEVYDARSWRVLVRIPCFVPDGCPIASIVERSAKTW